MMRVRFDALSRIFLGITSGDKHQGPSPRPQETENDLTLEKRDATEQDLKLKTNATRNSSGHVNTIGATSNHDKLERLTEAVKDLYLLRRQAKLINDTFRVYLADCHAVAFLSSIIMLAAMANEIRKLNGALTNANTEILILGFIGSASLFQIYTVSYITDLLQQSYDNLRFSLWQSDWYAENAEFKKLFFHTKAMLNQPLTMKAYSFYPINLRTFNTSLKEAFGVCLFLYRLTAPKE